MAEKTCLNCNNQKCYIVYGLPEEKKKDFAECQEHHENYDWEIEEDLENLKPLDYVKDVKVVAKIKKHWWKDEKCITLNSNISKDAIIQALEEELHKREVFYDVVTEEDFF